jgi:tRNA(Ile)-lysidine synthase
MPGKAVHDALSELGGQSLLVGLSGGLDSTVLLHALATPGADTRTGLRALHVHHGLHEHADQWSEHCLRLCASLGVPCIIEHVRVRRDSGQGMEGAARDARYAAFAKHLRAGESLVLAHHQDDQAETVLLRLLRGSGSDGLAAMRRQRSFADSVLLRPLLGLSRHQLLAYANSQGLSWCDDPSNEDDGPDRNFLRRQVMPLLQRRWPQASGALSLSAALLGEDARLLGEEADRRLEKIVDPHDRGVLRIPALLELDPAWQARVLRRWLDRQRLPPLRRRAYALIAEQLLAGPGDGAGEYRWSGAVLRRWRDGLHASWKPDALPGRWQRPWDGTGSLELPVGGTLRFKSLDPHLEAIDNTVSLTSEFGACRVASREGGERIRLPGRAHSHSLKHQLQQRHVVPWRRERMPLLFAGDGELLSAGDLIVSARLDAWCAAHRLSLDWRAGPDAGGD